MSHLFIALINNLTRLLFFVLGYHIAWSIRINIQYYGTSISRFDKPHIHVEANWKWRNSSISQKFSATMLNIYLMSNLEKKVGRGPSPMPTLPHDSDAYATTIRTLRYWYFIWRSELHTQVVKIDSDSLTAKRLAIRVSVTVTRRWPL